jgi:hypothetical protein
MMNLKPFCETGPWRLIITLKERAFKEVLMARMG